MIKQCSWPRILCGFGVLFVGLVTAQSAGFWVAEAPASGGRATPIILCGTGWRRGGAHGRGAGASLPLPLGGNLGGHSCDAVSPVAVLAVVAVVMPLWWWCFRSLRRPLGD